MSYGNAVMGAELAWVCGPFSIQSETKASWIKLTPDGDRVGVWGSYAEVSYFLTGEHRAYKKSRGIFTRVKPTNPFNPAQGKWGAWEVAARYSYIDLTDENVRGGTLWDVTAALNWYLYPNFRWMMNYVYGYVGDRTANDQAIQGGSNMVQTRFAFDF
jgi:phosphate-selective porin OprO/OprP